MASSKENIMRKMNKSRSKSPGHYNLSFDEVPEKGSAVKSFSEGDGSQPAWYKALKNKLDK